MKFSLILLVAAAEARHHHHHSQELLSIGAALKARGIDEKEMIEGNRWRKAWPEGVTDPSDGDDMVLNMEGFPKKKKAGPPNIKYEWTIDPEVLSTEKSLADTETKLGKKLGKSGW